MSSLGASADGREVLKRMEDIREQRRKAAVLVSLGVPVPPLADEDDHVLLTNRFGAELDVELVARDAIGRRCGTMALSILPARHRQLLLHELFAGHPSCQAGGSLELRYVGDLKMVQAWAIHRDLDGVMEVPFRPVGGAPAVPLVGYWDTRALPAAASSSPAVYLANFDRKARRVVLTYSIDGSKAVAEERLLPPGHQAFVSLAAATGANDTSGWLRLSTEETEQRVLAFAVLRGVGATAAMPLVSEPGRYNKDLRAIRVPALDVLESGEPLPRSVVATVFSPGPGERRVTLELRAYPSGASLAAFEDRLGGDEIASFDLASLVSSDPSARLSANVGFTVTSTGGPVLANVVSFDASGTAIDVPLADVRYAHGSGAYPVVDSRQGNTVTTLLNVGEVPADIGGHLSWNGGEYAIGPYQVAPGAALEMNVAELIARQDPDLLGRTPAVEGLEDGFLQWQSLGGSSELLGRTEHRVQGTSDVVGFNCSSCCEMEAVGDIIQGPITFAVGKSPAFQACSFLATCSGLNGPYPVRNLVLQYAAPLIWDGAKIRATGPTHQRVSFTGEGPLVPAQPSCPTIPRNIFAEEPVTAIQVTIQEASILTNRIKVNLGSGLMSVQGDLRVGLQSSSGATARVIFSGNEGTGVHTYTFGDLNSYPRDLSVANVVATWTVNAEQATASFFHAFTALGSYRQTCYNTPREGDFPATPTVVAGTSTAACAWGSAMFRARFLDEVNENGNGIDLAGQEMQPEQFCGGAPATSPTYCGGDHCRRYRVPTPIRTSCGNALVVGLTVARDEDDTRLRCGSQVFIQGLGSRTVQDDGDFILTPALDHYRGVGGAACNVWNNVDRPTFRIGS